MPVKRNLSAPDDESTIAGRLRLLRKERKVTQAVAAAAIGVHPVQLSEWEAGKWVPKAQALAKIADYYGVSTDWIVTGGLRQMLKSSLVPRGTSDGPGTGRQAKRLAMADSFEREMIRAGATDEDADYIRIRSRSYMESVLSSGGTELELSEDALDEEFEGYLEKNLRPQIEKRIKLRKQAGRGR